MHGRLMRQPTPYPWMVVMTGARDPCRPQLPNVESQRNEDAGASEAQVSCAGAPGGPANGGQ